MIGGIILLFSCNRSNNSIETAYIIDDRSIFVSDSITQESAKVVFDTVGIPSNKSSIKMIDFDTIHAGGKIYYIVDGDIAISANQLYNRLLINNNTLKIQQPRQQIEKAIIIKDDKGKIIKWPHFPINYCIDKRSFAGVPIGYNKIVQAAKTAAKEWADVSGVEFHYKSQLDNLAVKIGTDVDFVIRYKANDEADFVALSFFPEDETARHILFIYPLYWTTEYDPVGVFRHEFGHIVGFRHEQLSKSQTLPRLCRFEAQRGTVQIGTQYDQISVMHYVCGSFGSYDLAFSPNDKIAFTQLYPKP